MNLLFRPLLTQSFKTTGIYLLIIALTLAISATTALKFSNEQIQNAVALQAAEMLAGDLVLSDNEPLPEQWRDQAKQLDLQQSEVTFFSTMAYTDAQFVMVNVKAIDQAFPLRGELQLQPAKTKIQSGEIWLSPRAMDLLKVKLGDQLNIADAAFKVTAKIEQDSNQELGFSGFSPTVIISQADVARTNAIQVGSRIEYRLLMAGSPDNTQEYEALFKQQLKSENGSAETPAEVQGQEFEQQSSLRLRNASEGNTRLMKPIANLDTFLQLANILTILLCGIAIALTAQRYVQQNQDHIALMRCIGATKQQILSAYLALLGTVLLIAMSIGTVVGIGLGYGLLQLMLQLIPNLEIEFSAMAMLLGPLPVAMLTSAVVLLGFVMPSLLQLLNTPPIRVIRQQEKSVQSMLWMLLTGTLSLIIFSVILTENLLLTAWVIGAIIVLCAVLYLTVWLILKLLRNQKLNLSAYVRTPSQTALQITALALGLSLITVLAVLRTDLLERWQQQLPQGTPNQFVYGLPPFDMPDLKAQIEQNGWKSTPLYPNVRGRLVAKNDQPFAPELVKSNNTLKRELNLTQSNRYPQDNVIIRGDAVLQQVGTVSVEANTAEELGIKIGDKLSFSLPEGILEAKVVNLRTVEWESFSPNFFFIFAPNTMDANAGSYLGSFYVPEADKGKLVSVIQQFSNTVFIDVSLILEEIKRIVNVLVQIVTILAVLVSISGFLVLMACLNLLMDERKREVALLRSFGSSKQKLKTMMSLEIGFIGLFAGIVSCLFAEVISAIASYKMDLMIQPHWEIWIILPIFMTSLCALIGRYRLSYLSEIPPLQSLREMNQ
ncbi:FtsX-like permease family protein [Acinetobacter lwoffii]|uniref:FtsX-like permease family protein n=1 Tax=Acinetobacter lwoffii TaxID=28090 RepID=A0AAW8AX99_ACILW|nr:MULTISPECIES: FtsX-like permease family protein [Pseudomonadota]MCU4450505.1 FtsX-like permease family protein [Acinetobacter lwoffii]MDP1371432.1 FtsX-like permease family protein [Acinetobacter lwoffii]MDP1390934.1 FtsX-like permease family protein [Acinetobacter lwoffii]MDP1448580.1 FtsX-like permease family protein [Acinetobacter lwoffii]SPJ20229.1 FtsX-like permease family protein [Prolinoborus fasciculus]